MWFHIFLMIVCHPMSLLQPKLRIVILRARFFFHLKQPSPIKQETPPIQEHQFLRNGCCVFSGGTGHHIWYQVVRKIWRPGGQAQEELVLARNHIGQVGGVKQPGQCVGFLLDFGVGVLFWELGDWRTWNKTKNEVPFHFWNMFEIFSTVSVEDMWGALVAYALFYSMFVTLLAFRPSTSYRVPSNYCLVSAPLGEFSGRLTFLHNCGNLRLSVKRRRPYEGIRVYCQPTPLTYTPSDMRRF